MMRTSLSLFVPIFWGLAASGQTTITALVCNQIQMPVAKLVRAENEVSRILRSAGVLVRWSDCNVPSSSTREAWTHIVTVRVRNLAPLEVLNVKHGEPMGRAFLEDQRAEVYYNEVRQVARNFDHEREELTIFAYVMAHELGHLLLGPEHVRKGVMEAAWGRRELEMITRHELRFSPNECERMQPPLVANDSIAHIHSRQ
jgi:hypothetical protein